MLLKAIIFAVLAVAVIADEYIVTDEQRTQVQEIVRQQCKKNNAEDKTNDVVNAGKNFIECVKGLVDTKALNREIEEAKPKGALDEVFKKYCAKTPELKTCIHTILDQVSPCVDPAGREQMGSAKNSTDQLIDFICYKDGDRIALFISEGGPECFQKKSTELRACFANLRSSFTSVEDAKALSLEDKCRKFDELKDCVVPILETCENPTTGNMVESLIRYVRNGSACRAKGT